MPRPAWRLDRDRGQASAQTSLIWPRYRENDAATAAIAPQASAVTTSGKGKGEVVTADAPGRSCCPATAGPTPPRPHNLPKCRRWHTGVDFDRLFFGVLIAFASLVSLPAQLVNGSNGYFFFCVQDSSPFSGFRSLVSLPAQLVKGSSATRCGSLVLLIKKTIDGLDGPMEVNRFPAKVTLLSVTDAYELTAPAIDPFWARGVPSSLGLGLEAKELAMKC